MGLDDETEEPAGLDRFAGPDYKHAFGTPVVDGGALPRRSGLRAGRQGAARPGHSQQPVPDGHRPSSPDGSGSDRNALPRRKAASAAGDQANALAKAANAAVDHAQFDLLAPDPMLDEAATKEWIETADDVDAVAACDDLPAGPDDPNVPQESVDTMTALLTTLLSEAPLRVREGGDETSEDEMDQPRLSSEVTASDTTGDRRTGAGHCLEPRQAGRRRAAG